MNNRETAEKIFLEGVRSVLPGRLIRNIMSVSGSGLRIRDFSFNLDEFSRIFVIGAGKASAAMAHYVEALLGDRITGGHIVVKYGFACHLERIRVTEAGHPVPDENSFRATDEILRIAAEAGDKDLVICLISGGGSSLLADLPEGLLPEELYIVNNLLVRSGASIDEINCVRKHLSNVKGGHLARKVWPAKLVTLFISDVIGDPLDVIASGPTVPDPSTFADALGVIEKYRLKNDLTSGVLKRLEDGNTGLIPETPKPSEEVFPGTINILAGSNLIALEAAGKAAMDFGFNTFIVDSRLKSDIETASRSIVDTAISYKENQDLRKPVCLLYGGETTVRVGGNGTGGRNQHLALSVATRLQNLDGITFLSAGTDGNDGPTEVAGAVVDSDTLRISASKNLDPLEYLQEFDSYNFFRTAGGHIITGPTYTNVMDLYIVIID